MARRARTQAAENLDADLPPELRDGFKPAENQTLHEALAAQPTPQAEVEQVNGHRRHRGPRLNSRLTIPVGKDVVRMVDDGNKDGVGIQVEFADRNERPSEEVMKIIKENDDGRRSGFGWSNQHRQHRKGIKARDERVDEINPKKAIAIRMDAERRTEDVAEQLRYEKLPHAEREQRRREREDNSRIPD